MRWFNWIYLSCTPEGPTREFKMSYWIEVAQGTYSWVCGLFKCWLEVCMLSKSAYSVQKHRDLFHCLYHSACLYSAGYFQLLLHRYIIKSVIWLLCSYTLIRSGTKPVSVFTNRPMNHSFIWFVCNTDSFRNETYTLHVDWNLLHGH